MRMRIEKKNAVRNSVVRLALSILGFCVQTMWFVTLMYRFNEESEWIELLTKLITIGIVMALYVNDELNSSMKLLWIIVIISLPIMGLTLYLLYGRRGSVGFARKKHGEIRGDIKNTMVDDTQVLLDLEKLDYAIANEFRYVSNVGGFPVYPNQKLVFFPDPAEGLKKHIEAIEKAEHFIFMEYHAIEDSDAFYDVKKALIQAVHRGVEVRVIYDDVGSVGFLTTSFIRQLKKDGIECRVFNRVLPVLNIFMQNRDHRKIMVVDGKKAFTGGYNMADEYFGLTKPYGHWKDTGIYFEGEAANTFTAMFLYMWNLIKPTDQDYAHYFVSAKQQFLANGFIQPFGGNPLSRNKLPENVYLNLIKNAKHYVYLSTPYLIISAEMQRELTLAAQRGVDVRIVTPGIPDKKMIYEATRSYYPALVKGGVKIYEYTPGFCHAKQIISDDEIAIVGTINMDFRSLYHHFENAVLMYRVSILEDIRMDFSHMFAVAEHVSDKYGIKRTIPLRFKQVIMRLFSPLL